MAEAVRSSRKATPTRCRGPGTPVEKAIYVPTRKPARPQNAVAMTPARTGPSMYPTGEGRGAIGVPLAGIVRNVQKNRPAETPMIMNA